MLVEVLDVVLVVALDDDVVSEVVLLEELLPETWLSLLVLPSPKQPVNIAAVTIPSTIDLMLFFIGLFSFLQQLKTYSFIKGKSSIIYKIN